MSALHTHLVINPLLSTPHRMINGPYGIYARDASHNYYNGLSTHDNYETGFQLEGASANNTVLNLDSYRNRDPRKNGESADGFACKSGEGAGNVLRNARLWDNVDDGLDLFMFASPVTIEEVYSWGNGYNRCKCHSSPATAPRSMFSATSPECVTSGPIAGH